MPDSLVAASGNGGGAVTVLPVAVGGNVAASSNGSGAVEAAPVAVGSNVALPGLL